MTLQHLDTLIAFAVVMLGVSLLITILTQMVSAVLGLRGTNLLWGLKTLFETIDPRIEAQAEAVLRDPLISDSAFFSRFKKYPVFNKLPVFKWWTLASAIRPEELVRALTRISTDPNIKATTAAAIVAVLGEEDPEAKRKVKMLAGAFAQLSPSSSVQLDKLIGQFWETSRQSLGKLETEFNTVMDRVSQRFALQMRLLTVVFAVLVAFGAHLDSLKLVEQLWSDPEMRASLVASSEAMRKEAQAIGAVPEGSAQAVSGGAEPQAYAAALTTLQDKHPEATKDLEKPPAFDSLPAAVRWLEPRLKIDEAGRKNLIAEYTKLVAAELSSRANAIRTRLATSRWQLIPTPYPWPSWPPWPQYPLRHLLGILVSVAFLSLGAPFWFNALKSLSNLRPILAGRQAQEPGPTA